jgi:hypothetical protein
MDVAGKRIDKYLEPSGSGDLPWPVIWNNEESFTHIECYPVDREGPSYDFHVHRRRKWATRYLTPTGATDWISGERFVAECRAPSTGTIRLSTERRANGTYLTGSGSSAIQPSGPFNSFADRPTFSDGLPVHGNQVQIAPHEDRSRALDIPRLIADAKGGRLFMPDAMLRDIQENRCPYPECRKKFANLRSFAQHLEFTESHPVYVCCGRPFDTFDAYCHHKQEAAEPCFQPYP